MRLSGNRSRGDAWLLAAGVVAALTVGSCGTESATPQADAGADTADPCLGVSCPDQEVCIAGSCAPLADACQDLDGDGYGPFCALGEDCDDTNAAINPAAVERCDDVDNDCDFYIDEDGACAPCTPGCVAGQTTCAGNEVLACDVSVPCPRFGAPIACGAGQTCRDGRCEEACPDADQDGFSPLCGERRDCDDTRADVHPGAPEVCDGVDNNCDRRTDENFVCDEPCEDTCSTGDTGCTPDRSSRWTCARADDGCLRPVGIVACGANQRCDAGACVAVNTCVDLDGDGAGDGCPVTNDCRPLHPDVRGGGTQRCDGLDGDCDGRVDEGCASSRCEPYLPGDAMVPGGILAGRCTDVLAPAVALTGGSAIVVASVDRDDAQLRVGAMSGVNVNPTAGTFEASFGPLRAWIGTPPGGARVLVTAGGQGTTVALHTTDGLASPTACPAESGDAGTSPLNPIQLGDAPFAVAGGICSNGDQDYYRVNVPAGHVIEAVVGAPADGSNQLVLSVLRNEQEVAPFFGEQVVGGIPQVRRSHFRADLPGQYVVGVRGLTPETRLPYALAVRTSPGASCIDDAQEVTGAVQNDTVATAAPLAAGQQISGVLCAGDFDIYALGSLIDGTALNGTFSVQSGDLAVKLLYRRWSAPRDFPTNISATGEYYLAVYGETATAAGRYTLRWNR